MGSIKHHNISDIYILYYFYKENRKATVAIQYHGVKKKSDKMLLKTVIPRHAAGDVYAQRC